MIRGSKVQVGFVVKDEKLVGRSDAFSKISFVSNRYHGILPQAGEIWKCVVAYDTKPENSRLGALLLMPYRKLRSERTYEVVDAPGTQVGGYSLPRVVCQSIVENLPRPARYFRIRGLRQIQSHWPEEVKEKIVCMLEKRAQAKLRKRLRNPVEVTVIGVAINDYPFQWLKNDIGEWLTNGDFWFPRRRPEGSEWRDHPISAVPQECWEMFLAGLEGRFLDGLIPFHKEVISAGTGNPRRALTPRQEELGTAISPKMWQGNDECKRVGVGNSIVFHVDRKDACSLYLVDNPGVGAIYVFDCLETAHKLASGTLKRSAARAQGCTRIIHRNGWQQRVADVLATGVLAPATVTAAC